jgi:hypothetical protein
MAGFWGESSGNRQFGGLLTASIDRETPIFLMEFLRLSRAHMCNRRLQMPHHQSGLDAPLKAAARSTSRHAALRGCESNLTKGILGHKSLWRKQEI